MGGECGWPETRNPLDAAGGRPCPGDLLQGYLVLDLLAATANRGAETGEAAAEEQQGCRLRSERRLERGVEIVRVVLGCDQTRNVARRIRPDVEHHRLTR